MQYKDQTFTTQEGFKFKMKQLENSDFEDLKTITIQNAVFATCQIFNQNTIAGLQKRLECAQKINVDPFLSKTYDILIEIKTEFPNLVLNPDNIMQYIKDQRYLVTFFSQIRPNDESIKSYIQESQNPVKDLNDDKRIILGVYDENGKLIGVGNFYSQSVGGVFSPAYQKMKLGQKLTEDYLINKSRLVILVDPDNKNAFN